MNPKQRDDFLLDIHVGILSLNQPHRGPLSTPVWYWYEPGGHLWFETQPDSRKGRLLDIGTRISLCVQDEKPPYAYVSIEGPVIEIAEDDFDQHQVPMACRYLGEKAGREYLASLTPSEWKRYIVKPERWSTFNGSADVGK
ncbi:hypothetical protein BST96_08390 [Oceanicoccus sagamiensis]|uniref:Pyridoxamine 5'-phosphate oxidase N-terminal domain-containing protein n=2 Tax=Oceanicoccus sagamiensis TaxID=716816 RepID=A0A1X9N7U3_9GAMM|nr:hypothetical protein BST96_08390 [Oceanicoccus sagamiensis]